MNPVCDINFDPDYLRAYEAHEDGTLETFRYRCALGEGFVHYIRRPLSCFEGFDGYSDIITPYGYGGQMLERCAPEREAELITLFNDAFEQHCRQEHIVSYFARFHPFAENGPAFQQFFDEVTPIRKVIAMDLSLDRITDNLTSKGRYHYRSALERGVTVRLETVETGLDEFIDLYYELMDSKHAEDYYFFPREYFEYLFERFPDNVLLFSAQAEDQNIFFTLVLVYGDIAYSHLTCRKSGFNFYKANYAANIAVAEAAKARSCKYFMLGGGLSSDEKDPLYIFKKQFSNAEPMHFYVGKRIFDRTAYEALCESFPLPDELAGSGFFPRYRSLLRQR